MKVIFISFANFGRIDSGSSVRPFKIYSTFKENNYEVLLISGNLKERRKKFLKYKENRLFQGVDYCYIEPSTYPVHPLDFIMFEYIKTLNIPIGVFYRDAHYKFPELFKRSGFKKYELLIRYFLDWKMFKRISKVIFFPSDTMANYFDFKNKVSLPPAGEYLKIKPKKINYKVVYVGGTSDRYGTPILLEALKIVNNIYKPIGLNLVCRDFDDRLFKKYKNEEWLKIIKASGEQLEDIYRNSDMAIIPLRKNKYNDFAISVKLFEYMSHNLPILSTNCNEMEKFINDNNIGMIVKDNAKSIADAIIYMYENQNEIQEYTNNIKKVLVAENLWIHRIKKIEHYLLES